MKKIALEQLIPEPVEFDFGGRMCTLRAFTLKDKVWLQGAFGGSGGVEKVFSEVDMVGLCRIAYHQLKEDDRQHFKAVTTTGGLDDDGNPVKETMVTGPMQMAECIKDPIQEIAFLKAILATVGLSEPLLDDLEKEAVEEAEKKTMDPALTGEEFSTSSAMNTDGPGSISQV